QNPNERLRIVRQAIETVLDSPKLKEAPIGAALRKIADDYKAANDVQWLHDLLEENNQPFYFKDFIALAQQHGLQYLPDRHSSGSLVEERTPRTKSLLDSAGNDLIQREQLLDFLRNNMFRRTMLVKKEREIKFDGVRSQIQQLFVTTVLK